MDFVEFRRAKGDGRVSINPAQVVLVWELSPKETDIHFAATRYDGESSGTDWVTVVGSYEDTMWTLQRGSPPPKEK